MYKKIHRECMESHDRILKEYYEIVDEAYPLSGLFLTHADFFTQKYIYNQETKQASKFQSDPSSKFASQSTFEK